MYSGLKWSVEASFTIRSEDEQLDLQQKLALSQLLGKHEVVFEEIQ